MTIVLLLAGLIVMGLAISVLYEKQDLIKTAVMALATYLLSYILISGVLFAADVFTIKGCVAAVLLFAVILFLVVFLGFRRKPSVTFNWKSSVIPLAIFVIVLPVTFQKFGFFGMGQDQGVYQTKAIALMYGYTKNAFDLDELDRLIVSNPQDVAGYKSGIAEAYGMNLYNDTLDEPVGYQVGEGAFHGIPTYPAVLALWGSIFGYQNMGGVNTLFLLCGIFLLYGICENLRIKRSLGIAVTAIFAISPMVLWVSKSTLTENVTILIMGAFLYLLTDLKHEGYRWLAWFPVAVFAFLHVSVYVMMPMFVIIFAVYYLMTGQKRFLLSTIFATAAYKLGYMMMMSVSQTYTEGNYNFIQRLGISQRHIPMYTTIVVAVIIVIAMVLLFVPYKKDAVNRLADAKWFHFVMGWGARLAIVGCAYVGYKYIKHSNFSLTNATMYAYCAASAIVVIPLIIATIMVRPKLMMKNLESALMGFMFFYCVIIYSTVLSPYVIYYNYYSRYATVYLSIVLVFFAVLLTNMGSVRRLTEKWTKYPLGVVILVIAVVVYARYDIFIAHTQDESRMDWDMVEEVTNMVGENDALIIDGDIKNQLLYTTKILSGAKVFPVIGDAEHTVELAKQFADHVYYIKGNQDETSNVSLTSVDETVFEKVYTGDNYFRVYDKAVAQPGQMPYTLTSVVESSPVEMYRVR